MLRLARTPGSSYCRRLPGCTSTAPASRPKVSFAACALLPLRALASASALLLVQIACRHASASPFSLSLHLIAYRHASASPSLIATPPRRPHLVVARAPLPVRLRLCICSASRRTPRCCFFCYSVIPSLLHAAGMAGPLASPGFVSHGSPIPLPSSSNRLPPRLRVALITSFIATPPRRPVSLWLVRLCRCILLYILFVKLKVPRSLPKRRMPRSRVEFP